MMPASVVANQTVASIDATRNRVPRVLVVAEPRDIGALRVVRLLHQRSDVLVELISTDQLLLAPKWAHDPLGDTEIVLGNGSVLTNSTIDAVFCRIAHVNPPQFARAKSHDQLYAQGEFYSLILSWLEQLGTKVHNQPHAGNLSGFRSSPLEDHLWFASEERASEPVNITTNSRHLKKQEGVVVPYLPCSDESALAGRPFEPMPEIMLTGQPVIRLADPVMRPRHHITVVGDRVFGEVVSPKIRKIALRAAQKRNLTLAELTLNIADGDQIGFCAIDPFPSFKDPATIEAAANLLGLTALGDRA